MGAHTEGMTSPYARPLAELDAVHVAPEDQLEEQDVDAPREYVDPEDLDRARLLSIEHGGRLRVR